MGESQCDSGNWSESVHTGVHDDEDLARAPKFDDIMSRLESATRQIRNKVTSSVLIIRIKEPPLIVMMMLITLSVEQCTIRISVRKGSPE